MKSYCDNEKIREEEQQSSDRDQAVDDQDDYLKKKAIDLQTFELDSLDEDLMNRDGVMLPYHVVMDQTAKKNQDVVYVHQQVRVMAMDEREDCYD